MKRFISILGLLTLATLCSAQTFRPDVVKRGLITKKDSTLKAYDFGYDFDFTVPLSLRTPALQLTFTRVEKVNDKWELTTPIIVGYSYIFSYANGIIHQDSSITVETRFFFGGGLNFGITPDLTGGVVTSVPVGGIVGYSRYGGFVGIDVLTGKPMFGVSINLLNVPVLQSLTKFKILED